MPEAEIPSRSSRPVRSRTIGAGLRLGRILGFEVYADWSLTLIFALVLFNLGLEVFPSWHPSWSPLQIWMTAGGAAVLFFGSVLAHELSHSIVARSQGLRVRRITLFIFGGAAQIEDEPASPREEFLVAVVGPLTSMAIGVLSLLGVMLAVGRISTEDWSNPADIIRTMGPVETLLLWLGPINILLGLFNIVPGFPLDGGRVFRAFVWWLTDDVVKATRWAAATGQLFGWALIFVGLTSLLGGATVQGLWLLVIGWFLNSAAGAGYRQMFTDQTLRNVRVAEVMRPNPRSIDADASVQVFVDDLLSSSEQKTYPVVSDQSLVGFVRLKDVRKIPREKWPWSRVAEIMSPREQALVLDSETPAAVAARRLNRPDVDEIPVLENGFVVGLVEQEDILKWITLHPPSSR